MVPAVCVVPCAVLRPGVRPLFSLRPLKFKAGLRKRPVYKKVELRQVSSDYWTCSFRVGAGLVGETPSQLDLHASNSHKMNAPPAITRGERTSLDRSYGDVMAVYDSDSEPLARRSTKAIKKRRKSLKRLSLNTQIGRDARAKKRRGAA